jgi:hypothetical protein
LQNRQKTDSATDVTLKTFVIFLYNSNPGYKFYVLRGTQNVLGILMYLHNVHGMIKLQHNTLVFVCPDNGFLMQTS